MPRGRPRQFDRDKALQDAMMVFWANGYHATSMPVLCEAMGIDVKSLYAAFGNKEKLFVETVGLYMKATQDLLWAHLEIGEPARGGRGGGGGARGGGGAGGAARPGGGW